VALVAELLRTDVEGLDVLCARAADWYGTRTHRPCSYTAPKTTPGLMSC
jgi:hypothetical protein